MYRVTVSEPGSAPARVTDRYRLIAPIYDAMTVIASGRAIRRCRSAAARHVVDGARVLVVGAGHGSDVVDIVNAGAGHVVVVERSPAMIRALNANLERGDVADRVTVICDDAFNHVDGGYDVVVANFFLNVFGKDDEARMRAHLIARLGDDGVLVVGDFAAAPSGFLRVLGVAYWYTALITFRLLTHNAVRPMTDHVATAAAAGLVVTDVDIFRFCGVPLYASVAARRPHHA